MKKEFILEELPDESLDAILCLTPAQKTKYFSLMVKTYYPNQVEGSKEFTDLLETYISSFYVEKLYRSNRFFHEKFSPVYTSTGLIRDVVADIFYTDDHIITH